MLLAELGTLGLPRLQTVLSEAVAYGEIGFSGVLPPDGGPPAAEIAALIAELRAGGWLPACRKPVGSKIYGNT